MVRTRRCQREDPSQETDIIIDNVQMIGEMRGDEDPETGDVPDPDQEALTVEIETEAEITEVADTEDTTGGEKERRERGTMSSRWRG